MFDMVLFQPPLPHENLHNYLEFPALMVVIIIIFNMIVAFYIYKKVRIWILSLISLMFSIFFMIPSFDVEMPLNPWFQLFNVLINTIIFLMISLEINNRK